MLGSTILSLALAVATVNAHIVLTYPGSRGNNLITNDTFPYGMQWMYPCTLLLDSSFREFLVSMAAAVAVNPPYQKSNSLTNLQAAAWAPRATAPSGPRQAAP